MMARLRERLKAKVLSSWQHDLEICMKNLKIFLITTLMKLMLLVLQFLLLALEDITYSDDEEDVRAEADFTNLETNITVSHIPTTRVHKDHHVTQIISDLSSATQTKSMTRMVKDQGGLTQINNEDFHTCMFACFLLQEEPKRVHQALKDPSWIEAMQEELLQFKMQKMDVKIAFLYVTIKEEVYVCQPLGFEDPDYPDKVYKVVKALYGLHQAPRAWYETLKPDGIFISQDKYVAEILRKFGLTDGKSASTPIDTEKPLLKDPDGEDVDVHTYRSMVGSLMYLTSLRLDIMFAVCACAHFQVTPTALHLHAVKRIFKYLKGKPHLGLWYPKDSPFNLVAYSDSDYAGASLDRMSTTGGYQFLGCRLISWQCKKKTVIATSSTEAEYVAATSCCAHVLWIQNQLLDYGLIVSAVSLKFLLLVLLWLQLSSAFQQGRKRIFRVETPLFEGMIVAQQADDVADEVAANVDVDDVPAADAEPTLPSPTPTTQPLPPPPPQELPFISQNLEQAKISQALEITRLKERVKILEKKNKVKVSGLRRLKKVGTAQRVESFADTVMDDQEDAYKQGEIIANIDTYKDVTLKDVADDKVEENVLSMHDDEPEPIELKEVVELVTTAKLMTDLVTAAATITAATTPITAATITVVPSAARRRKGVVIRDLKETTTSSTIIHSEPKSKDKGKGIMVQEPKPLKKQARIEYDEAYARELEAELNKNINWDDVIEHVKEKGKQDNVVLRYQALKRKPQTEAQARKNMMIYLRNMVGFKLDYFKGMSYDDIRLIFEKYFNSNVTFLEKTKKQLEEEESRALKRTSKSLKEKATKKQKLDEEDDVIEHVKEKGKQDNVVLRYQALKMKPQTEAQARKNMMIYLRNMAGFKLDYFKGMSYDDIRLIFKKYFNSNVAFLEKTKEQLEEEESRALKRTSESLEEKATKKQKLDEEVEELKKHLQIVPNDDDDVYTEATPLALKIHVVDYKIYTENNKPYYKIIRADGFTSYS
nr:uncharacterized mitochondrial protein AtMg00810-like [Tanacetum cinerariifolium]